MKEFSCLKQEHSVRNILDYQLLLAETIIHEREVRDTTPAHRKPGRVPLKPYNPKKVVYLKDFLKGGK